MSVAQDYLHTVGTWITEGAPDNAIPEEPMAPIAAMRLVEQELAVEGIPERNLATFVTTWMEPEARVVIDENLHRNFIDHAEYPHDRSRSSSAASGCWPSSSTRPARRPAPAPRAPRRRSCSAPCR